MQLKDFKVGPYQSLKKERKHGCLLGALTPSHPQWKIHALLSLPQQQMNW